MQKIQLSPCSLKSRLLSGPVAGNKDEQRHIEVTDPL